MRKGEADGQAATTPLSLKALQILEDKGFKFVKVKGLTLDKHYEYVEPHFLLLLPIRELPTDQSKKDIYEPIGSDLLKQWANDINSNTEVFISKKV
jgi:hypothetical protein